MQQIEKLDSISYDQFVENFAKPGKPVILKNASANWRTDVELTPDYFRRNFGDRTVKNKDRVYSMAEILDITEKSTPENPAPYPIFFELPLDLPELLSVFNPIHMNYAFPNWFRSKLMPRGRSGNNIQLFIGGAGNQYPLHKDMYHTDAWITQLYGDKDFVAFPRGQEEFLYPTGYGYRSPINIMKPDYKKYPNYKHATPIRVTLKPGETIYIPNGIWHTTVASGHNISLIFDQLNDLNFRAWRKDVYDYGEHKGTLKRLVTYSFALTVGALCKIGAMAGYRFK